MTLEERVERLETIIVGLEQRLRRQEIQNIGNVRLGPDQPYNDSKWMEDGKKLMEMIVEEANKRKV